MGYSSNDRIRFEFIKKENGNVFYRDTDLIRFPFVVVDAEKMEELIRPIRTTKDLMDVQATLFNNEKDAIKYITKEKEVN